VLWQGDKVILHHAPLAVDFFFALSGFVIGYAYDDRWSRMSVGQFLRLRLVRLHPLVILGVLLGFASYLLDPGAPEQAIALSRVVVALVMGLLIPLGHSQPLDRYPSAQWPVLEPVAGIPGQPRLCAGAAPLVDARSAHSR
jgi:peptidoglycan/LPS O-acetylase OafA/YrhL